MILNLNRIALIFSLWIAGLLAGGQFAKISVIIPELQALYPSQAGQIAWLLTLVSAVGAILGGFAASIANRYGLVRILTASLALAGILSLWQSTYPSFEIMAISRVIEGATHLGIVVTAPALMAEASSDRWRGATMALWGTFFGVSFAIFGWFGIPLLEQIQISGLFQLHGAGLIATALLIAVLLKTSGTTIERSEAAQTPPSLNLTAFRDVCVLWPGIGWLFYTLTFLALLTILPAQLPDELRSQATTILPLVSIATGVLILPVLLMRFSASTMVMVGFISAALILSLGGQGDLLILATCLFAVLGLIQSGTFAAVAELNISTEKRTLGYGVMAQTGNLGNLVGTPLLLLSLDKYGLQSLQLITAMVYVAAFAVLTVLAGRMKRSV